MVTRWMFAAWILLPLSLGMSGCMSNAGGLGSGDGGRDTAAVTDVANKAVDVAAQVGGVTGFGGSLMTGYSAHAPSGMGFNGPGDLADPDDHMTVRLRNDSAQGCTFHLSYFAGHMGPGDQMMDIDVNTGGIENVDLPCSEIVGVGPLDAPGQIGCHLDDGQAVDNMMAVPGFLGLDYTCGGVYACVLTPDVDDLDGDGDTEELILVTDGMQNHMFNGGPMGHMHGFGQGMMGPHMGGF